MKLDQIDMEARRLEAEVNDRLSKETPGWPAMVRERETERVIGEVLGEDWEWMTRMVLNGATQIHITQYRGEIARD